MMQSVRFLMLLLLLAGLSFLASGCATQVSSFPPSADLQPRAKPLQDPDKIGSEAYLIWYNIELEVWGQEGWDAVRRLCEFHKSLGMKIDCTPQK